ncbi:hypothetical protein [[Clostridium] aminophilum]|uniref:hypothetical protein n=1 Tax=[Clostridium] aminophilum TaxID=1526 RepID=UPI0015A5D720|nr:hypothetical protein [[Clostridium] aminophilum]
MPEHQPGSGIAGDEKELIGSRIAGDERKQPGSGIAGDMKELLRNLTLTGRI